MRLHRRCRTYSVWFLALLGAACGEGGSSTAPGTKPTAPGTPPAQPTVPSGDAAAAFSPPEASQGDFVRLDISYPAQPGGGPLPMVVEFGGTVQGRDSVDVPAAAGSVYGTFTLPPGLPDGELTATVTFPTWRKTATARLAVRDVKPPTVDALARQVGPPAMPDMYPGQTVFRAGATAQLHVRGRDNNALAWMGYAAGPPLNVRDSVAVSGTAAADTVDLAVPAALAGGTTSLTAFVRDRNGLLAEQKFNAVPVYELGERPVRSAPLDAPVRDAAYDAARRLLYLSQPDRSQVAVLSLETMTYEPPIPLSIRPAGLDLTPGGDTLLVGLSRSVYLGVVDLRAAARRAERLRVQFAPNPMIVSPLADTAMIPSVEDVRVAANGRILVTLAHEPSWAFAASDKLVEIDRAAGRQRVVYTGPGGPRLPLVATADRRTVLALNTGGGNNPPGATRYDAATDSYAPPQGASKDGYHPAPASAAATGSFYVLGRTLYDGELRPLRQFGFTGYVSERTVISPSGTHVFVAAQFACGPFGPAACPPETAPAAALRYDAASGRLVEMVPTPQFARDLAVLPDGQTLVAFGPSAIALVDLRQPAPSSTASATASVAIAPIRKPATDDRGARMASTPGVSEAAAPHTAPALRARYHVPPSAP